MKKGLKFSLIGGGSLALVGIIVVLYLFNMPHRDVQGEDASFTIEAQSLVDEFLNDAAASNAKYLDKVVIVSGTVSKIETDKLGQKVVLLKAGNSGVNCTFTIETNKDAEKLKDGDIVNIKGIVRLGASYDEDMDLVEYVILEKADVVKS